MSDEVVMPKPLLPVVIDKSEPRKPRQPTPRDPAALVRIVKKYNELDRWGWYPTEKPRFSQEEKVFLRELLEKWKAGEIGEYRAVGAFLERFPFRTRQSMRWRFRKLRDEGKHESGNNLAQDK